MSKRSRRSVTTTSARDDGGQARNFVVIGAILLGVIALGVLVWLNVREPPAIADLITYPRPSRGHDNTVEYPTGDLPPAGGIHFDIWQNCGIYAEPINPGNAVHSMEHGAVWITYDNISEEEIDVLEQQVRGEGYLLLSPNPGQSSPIVLTAWGFQLELETAEDDRIGTFIERYRNGPQTPERGAACTNGTGVPQG